MKPNIYENNQLQNQFPPIPKAFNVTASIAITPLT